MQVMLITLKVIKTKSTNVNTVKYIVHIIAKTINKNENVFY